MRRIEAKKLSPSLGPMKQRDNVFPGYPLPLIFKTVLTLLVVLLVFFLLLPRKTYCTRKTSSERLVSERKLVSSLVL